jgi:tetratricopeptide (TPR) repeat protein
LIRRFTSTARVLRSVIALIASLGAAGLHAHPEIEAALTRLNTEIAAAPAAAGLYLERGELYAKHQEWVSAEANYLRAAELSPSLPRLDCARGSLAFATGSLREARTHFDRALALNPDDAEAFILRARVRVKLSDQAGARSDFEAGLQRVANPRPELFLERAALLPPLAAIQSLNVAIARIGPIHTLQLRALELEEKAGLIDAALARLEIIAAHSERKERWLKHRGDVLARAGRARESREAYAAALAAIAALPVWLRDSPDAVRLSLELTQLAPTS